MSEEVIIQTVDEVKNIDYIRNNNQVIEQAINEQTNQVNTISEALTDIQNSIDSTTEVDLSEVTTMIENIDTTVVETQTQDILSMVNDQQKQINSIQSDINDINSKLDQILDKL